MGWDLFLSDLQCILKFSFSSEDIAFEDDRIFKVFLQLLTGYPYTFYLLLLMSLEVQKRVYVSFVDQTIAERDQTDLVLGYLSIGFNPLSMLLHLFPNLILCHRHDKFLSKSFLRMMQRSHQLVLGIWLHSNLFIDLVPLR